MGSADGSWRVFAAIEIPQQIQTRLQQHINTLKMSVVESQPSWSKVDNVHLTIKFFGDVEIDKIDKISEAASRAVKSLSRFEIAIEGSGAFPKPSHPRVLWIGVKDRTGKLAELQRVFDEEFAVAGFAKEERAFRPHLTIARIKKPNGARELAEANQKLGFRSENLPVNELVIFRSQLSSTGSIYTRLTKHPLR